METDKGISFPNISIQDFLKVGSDAVKNQLMKMTAEKIIAPYSLVEFHRMVVDLYKDAFTKCKNGGAEDESVLTEAQNRLNFAIDHAKVHGLPCEELEALKNDINYLKYELI